MACHNHEMDTYSPEQVTEITQRYYSKGILFRRGKLARQMQAIRDQSTTARAMDDGHRQLETQLIVKSLFAGLLCGVATFFLQQYQEAATARRLAAYSTAFEGTTPHPTPCLGDVDGDTLLVTESELQALLELSIARGLDEFKRSQEG